MDHAEIDMGLNVTEMLVNATKLESTFAVLTSTRLFACSNQMTLQTRTMVICTDGGVGSC